MEDIVLSIIIPCYNVEDSVERLLHSIFGDERYPIIKDCLEVLIVEDSSQDDTLNRINRSQYFDLFTLVRHERNFGLQAARSSGFKRSKGRYLISIDSDDELVLESLLSIWKDLSSGEFDIFIFNYFRQNGKGEFYKFQDQVASNYCHFKGPVWNKIVRRRFVLDSDYISDYSLRSTEDLVYCASIWQSGMKISYVQRCLLKYYHNSSGIQGSMKLDNYIDNQVEVGNKLLQILKTKNLPKCIVEHYLAHIYVRQLALLIRREYKRNFEIDIIQNELYSLHHLGGGIFYRCSLIFKVFNMREIYFKLFR